MTTQTDLLSALTPAELSEYNNHCAQVSLLNAQYNLESKWQLRISPMFEPFDGVISSVSMFQQESRLAREDDPEAPKKYQGVRIEWGGNANEPAAIYTLWNSLGHDDSKKINDIITYLLPAIGRAREMEKYGLSVNAPMPWCFASTPFLARLTRFHAEHQDGNHGDLARQGIGETHGVIHTLDSYSIFGDTSYQWSGPGEPEKIILRNFGAAIEDNGTEIDDDDDEFETGVYIPESSLQGMKGIALSRAVEIEGMDCSDIIIEDAKVDQDFVTFENLLILYLRPSPLVRCGSPPTGVEYDPMKSWMAPFL